MTADSVASSRAVTGENRPATLDTHLDSLMDLWALAPTPVWIADVSGTIVYSNPAARFSNRLGEVAASIGEAMLRSRLPHAVGSADSRPIDVSALVDGRNRRLGWLAMRQPSEPQMPS